MYYYWSVSFVYQLFCQFLIFLVDQILFWQTKFFLVHETFFWSTKSFFWSTNFFFGIPIFSPFFLVDQKNEKLTGQLVYQRDWPIICTWTPLLCSTMLNIFFQDQNVIHISSYYLYQNSLNLPQLNHWAIFRIKNVCLYSNQKY